MADYVDHTGQSPAHHGSPRQAISSVVFRIMRPMIMAGTLQRAWHCLALLLGLNLYSSLLPLRADEPLINNLGMEFITVPAGAFTMGTLDLEAAAMERPDGSSEHVRDESPPHPVRFPEAFQLGRTEVTQEQWLKVMGTRPGPESHWQRADWRDLPVVSVTWLEVAQFIEALNRSAKGFTYRLPTEAEWEYAARAGSEGLRPMPDDTLPDHAWYLGNSGDVVKPVATRQANHWGLHDMLGNVWEWTADWYSPDYYATAPGTSPPGPAEGTKKVRRGGSYHCPVHMVRPGYRAADDPAQAYSVVGFRIIAERDGERDSSNALKTWPPG